MEGLGRHRPVPLGHKDVRGQPLLALQVSRIAFSDRVFRVDEKSDQRSCRHHLVQQFQLLHRRRSVGPGRLGLAAWWLCRRSPDRTRGRFGWLNLSTRASDGGFWRWEQCRRALEWHRPQCGHLTAAVADDTAARMRAAREAAAMAILLANFWVRSYN